MPNASVRANARTMSNGPHLRRRRPVSRSIRYRLETTLENLLSLLDELDGDADFEPDQDAEADPAESGIADYEGLGEQISGEPSLGATVDIDQRVAWGADRLSYLSDGEATGTEDDIETHRPTEAWRADRAAADAARNQLRQIVRRRRTAAQA